MNILLYKRYRKEALEWVLRLSAGDWIGLQYGNLKKIIPSIFILAMVKYMAIHFYMFIYKQGK